MEESRNSAEKPNSPGAEQASSATGVFGQVSAAPAPAEEDLLASLLKQAAPEKPASVATDAAAPPVPSPEPASAATPEPAPARVPGEFTRMLQALTDQKPGAAPASGRAESARTEDVARVFSPVAMEKPRDSRVTAGMEKPAAPTLGTENAAAGQAGSGPGAFTRMFSSMSAAPAAEPGAPPAQAPPPAAPANAGPGEFTRTFLAGQGNGSPAEPPPAAKSEPGAFTRMFSSSAASAPVPAAAPPQPAAAVSGPGEFTRIFSTAAAPPQDDPLKSLRQESAPEIGLKFAAGLPRNQEPATPAQGGFTQLLQALNQEPSSKSAPLAAPAPMPPPAQAPPAPAAAGGFTQLLQSLSAQPDAAPAPLPPAPAPPPMMAAAPPPSPLATPPMMPPAAPPPVASSGPGEFTRVISGSALRDLQSQGAVSAVPPPPVSAGGSAWTLPAMPKAPGTPAMPQMPSAQVGGAQFAPPAFAFPPTVPPPPPAPAAAPPTTLQKYLPLILVLNVFLLLAVVLILIFMFHHK